MRRRKTILDRLAEKAEGMGFDPDAVTGRELLETLRLGAEAGLSVSVQPAEALKMIGHAEDLRAAFADLVAAFVVDGNTVSVHPDRVLLVALANAKAALGEGEP